MSKQTKVPDTSIDAYREKLSVGLNRDYALIAFALRNLCVANYCTIASFLRLEDKNVVSRRLKEMIGLNIVERMDTKSKTQRGRDAYNHKLTEAFIEIEGNNIPPAKTNVRRRDQKKYVQPSLFDNN